MPSLVKLHLESFIRFPHQYRLDDFRVIGSQVDIQTDEISRNQSEKSWGLTETLLSQIEQFKNRHFSNSLLPKHEKNLWTYVINILVWRSNAQLYFCRASTIKNWFWYKFINIEYSWKVLIEQISRKTVLERFLQKKFEKSSSGRVFTEQISRKFVPEVLNKANTKKDREKQFRKSFKKANVKKIWEKQIWGGFNSRETVLEEF